MASRKVLQEIAILPPETEQQSFVVVTEEAMPDPCVPNFSFPVRAHAKYISNDESKENMTPAEFENIHGEKYKYEMSDVGKPEDPMCSNSQESSSGSSCEISAWQKADKTFKMAAGESLVSDVTPMKDLGFSDWRIGESDTPVDFSRVTVDDFGISSEKFTNSGGKSPRSLHKHRRRSTIGVRGSPEMNFLIRQIALQRSTRQSHPEPVSNPFISPRNSALKEKMFSFQNAFQAVEESEGKLPFPGFSEEEEGTQSDVLKNKGNTSETSEPPEKRKKACDASLPKITSVPVKPHAPLLSSQLQETAEEIKQVPVQEKISESASASRLLSAVSKSVDVEIEEVKPVQSSTRGRKRKVMFTDLSNSPESKKAFCSNWTQKSDGHSSSVPILRPVLKKTSRNEFSSFRDELGDQRVCFSVPETSENESNTLFKKPVNDSVKKKKRVTFGRELSPELFDKTLPANTPLRKGSTPYRQQASESATPTQELVHHQSPCQPLAQPDFDCKDEEDSFKPMSLCFDIESPRKDSTVLLSSPEKDDHVLPADELVGTIEENNHKTEEEKQIISCDVAENAPEATPALGTGVADEKDDHVLPADELVGTIEENNHKTEEEKQIISCDVAENAPEATPALGTGVADESLISEADTLPAKSRVTRFSNRSKTCNSKGPPTSNGPPTADTSKVTATAKPSKRGRKPVIIKKAQVKAPRSKGKKSRARPKMSLQKSLYGARETVSKKPLLSPIPEMPECYATPSTPVSLDDTLNRGFVNSIPKRRGIRKVNRKVHKSHVDSEAVNSSDPTILRTEEVAADKDCPGQQCLEVKQDESLLDSLRPAEAADSALQVETSNTECSLSSIDVEVKQDEECLPEPGESMTVPEDEDTETMTVAKPLNESKRRSRRVSQTTSEIPLATNTDLLENIVNAEHDTVDTSAKDLKPETEVLVENQVLSPKLPLTTGTGGGRRGRRSSRNYSKSAIVCPITEPNTHPQDPTAMLPHLDENSMAFNHEPCLPIDEILQGAGTEKKVRRSLRLRRDSGASGLIWVQEKIGGEGTKRRKSLSSAVQPLRNFNLNLESGVGSPNKKQVPKAAKRKSLSSAVQLLEGSETILESVTLSPNKEQQIPNAAKKTRRRTLCTSTLQPTTSLGDSKRRRRSNVLYKDSSVESQTSHNNITLDT